MDVIIASHKIPTTVTSNHTSSLHITVMATTAQPFICGGLSACLASGVVHPIDLSKVQIQLYSVLNPGMPKPSFASILSTMIKEKGVSSIYAGLSASLMRQACYGTARLGLHRSFSDALIASNNGQPLSFFSKVGSGMLSGAMAVCVGTPFDVALIRMVH